MLVYVLPILNDILESLHPKEKQVLIVLGRGFTSFSDIVRETSFNTDTVIWALNLLKDKELIKIVKDQKIKYSLGVEGQKYLETGFPEVRLIKKLREETPIEELNLSNDELSYGISWAIRHNWVKIQTKHGKKFIILTDNGKSYLSKTYEFEEVLKKINSGHPLTSSDIVLINELKKRGDIVREKIFTIITGVELTSLGHKILEKLKLEEEVTSLTSDIIISGKWKYVRFKPYDIDAPTESLTLGRKHLYREIIDEIREILLSLGFEEVSSPPIELNFWNCDALFMPSDHPARSIHDIFYIKGFYLDKIQNQDLLKKIKETHENGWITGSIGWGSWDQSLALKFILRSQTTAVSARYLSKLSQEDLPRKMFIIDKNYRPDKIDAMHLPEFNQCEGIVVAENVNLRHLMGYMKTIAEAFNIKDIRFQPAFFPFTEPSIVGYIKHPTLGWIEALPGGIFRPEVTLPLGVKVPVLAWGLGIDRLAMVALNIDDIRLLFSRDLEWLRTSPIPSLKR